MGRKAEDEGRSAPQQQCECDGGPGTAVFATARVRPARYGRFEPQTAAVSTAAAATPGHAGKYMRFSSCALVAADGFGKLLRTGSPSLPIPSWSPPHRSSPYPTHSPFVPLSHRHGICL